MTTVTYDRPSGFHLTVNDTPETREYAKENGWTLAGDKKEVKTAKPKGKDK